MEKNELRVIIVDAILLVVFSIIAFVPPFEKTALFWCSYVFGVVAIACQLGIFRVSFQKGGDAKSKFYGFPIAKIGVMYVIAQMILSVIEMALANIIPAWIGVIINVILMGVVLVGTITADLMRDEIVKQDVELKKDVQNMRKLQSLTASFVGMCNDSDVKSTLQELADEFKYSDPVTSEDTETLENELLTMANELQQALIDGELESVRSLCVKVKAALAERNRVCKVGK